MAVQVPAPPVREEKKDENSSEPEKKSNGNGRENQTVYTKSISIKGLLKGVAREIPVVDEEIEETDLVTSEIDTDDIPEEITEGDMQKVWDEYARSMQKLHPRISSTLQQQKPRMTETGIIQIHLNSNAQRENFIQNIKPGLTRFFQEKLANIDFVFETNLIENETTVKKVYTDHDKLEYMINKNKDLETFKARFNLDFDD